MQATPSATDILTTSSLATARTPAAFTYLTPLLAISLPPSPTNKVFTTLAASHGHATLATTHTCVCVASRPTETAGRLRFSHFLGVSWDPQKGVWQARIHKADGSPHCLGDFPQEVAAGKAYDEYALQHLGKGAVRNFPPSTYTGKGHCTTHAYGIVAHQYYTVMASCYTAGIVLHSWHDV